MNLFHHLWRKIPRGFRDRWLFEALNRLAPRPLKNPQNPMFACDTFIVGGFFSSPSGFARSAELLAQLLERLGKRVVRLDLSPLFYPSKFSFQKIPLPVVPPNAPLIIHFNPPYFGYIYLRLGRAFIKSRPIIGYWAFECPEIPPSWKSTYHLVTDVWAASRFCQDVFQKHTSRPVAYVPHPIEPYQGDLYPRSHFGISEHTFLVTFVFHIASTIFRKNPYGAITAFQKAFPKDKDEDVLFVIRVNGAAHSMEEIAILKKSTSHDARIRLITEPMTYSEVQSLIACCDAYLSLHRSEGFGLTIAEALSFRRQVVTTGWSGNEDFTTDKNSFRVPYTLTPSSYDYFGAKDVLWAEPNLDHAAYCLRDIYEGRQKEIEPPDTKAWEHLKKVVEAGL